MPLSKAINPHHMDLPKTGKLSSYPLKGPKTACPDRFKLHSLPRDAQAKREGQFTAKVDFIDTKSSFGTKQGNSRVQAAPSFSVGGPEGPGPDRNRFKVHSLPKATAKKMHGLETLQVGFMDAPPTLGAANPVSTVKNAAAFTFGGGKPMEPRQRFKYDSLDKDVLSKMHGNCTPATIDFASQQSSFGKDRVLSADQSLPAFTIGKPGGLDKHRDRFQYHSLPKETVKKYFGMETKHLGFVNAPSFFGGKSNPLSTVQNCAVPMLGDPTGPNPSINRFTTHSLPKETVKKLHGLETLTVDYMNAPSCLNEKTISFSKSAKLQGPLGGASQVDDDYFWRSRVKSEQHAIVRAAGGLRPSTSSSSVQSSGGGGRSARGMPSARPSTSGAGDGEVRVLSHSRTCPAIPALSIPSEFDGRMQTGRSLSRSATLRQAKYDQMRSSVKSREAAQFADTLATLDKKLQMAKEKAKDPRHTVKAKKAIRSLQKLVDKMKSVEVRNIRYTATLKD